MSAAEAGTVLWWGRFDPGYSRNRILRGLLPELGWRVLDFHPRVSALGELEYRLHRQAPVDLLWVPCFRQRDLATAARLASRLRVPLLADPLVSAWDKQVHERGKFAPHGVRARRLLAWERARLQAADRVLADTAAHARFFIDTFDLLAERVHVLPVGAEEALFKPAPPSPAELPEVLFYGSFIGLQAPEIIVEAARLYQGPPLRWTLLGDGPRRRACEAAAAGSSNVVFEPPLPYASLPARIHRAQILLGVFGASDKAGRVIPNKVYQALACGRPVVTRDGEGYPADMRASTAAGVSWVPPADPVALAAAVAALVASPVRLATEAGNAERSYRRWLGSERVREALAAALAGVNPPPRG